MQTIERKRVLIVGKVNAGKSTLFNRILRQKRSLASPIHGTTTDCIAKVMELPNWGPIILVDTPGLEDITVLGKEREENTKREIHSADLILYILSKDEVEIPQILSEIQDKIPILPIILNDKDSHFFTRQVDNFSKLPISLSINSDSDIINLLKEISSYLKKEDETPPPLLGNLCKKGDFVILVMPQDTSAPQGRLILPQVQTLRALLDRGCISICVTPEMFTKTLGHFAKPPALIITDSQVFEEIEIQKPKESKLTSFSVLMSAQRGDLKRFIKGAEAFYRLNDLSKVLIAEACTHSPDTEDIGTIKIPQLLRKRLGKNLEIVFTSGKDFPTDLREFDLVIHCGGCMFNRRLLLSRQDQATKQGVALTNYGIAIASLLGILDKIALP